LYTWPQRKFCLFIYFTFFLFQKLFWFFFWIYKLYILKEIIRFNNLINGNSFKYCYRYNISVCCLTCQLKIQKYYNDNNIWKGYHCQNVLSLERCIIHNLTRSKVIGPVTPEIIILFLFHTVDSVMHIAYLSLIWCPILEEAKKSILHHYWAISNWHSINKWKYKNKQKSDNSQANSSFAHLAPNWHSI